MSWAYLVTFDSQFASRKDVQEFLNTVPEVTYWYACLPHCVFFTSTLNAATLAKKFEERFDISKGQEFLVTEVHTDRQGRLPKAAWHLIRNPDDPRLKE